MTYFYPLALTIDTAEKESFLKNQLPGLKSKYGGTGHGLVNVGTVTELFPTTIAQTNQLVESLGLRTRAVTLFAGDSDSTSYAIHADGVYYNRKPTLLEARLSYYELADSPGKICWWDKEELPVTIQEYAATKYSQARVNVMANCVEDLQAGRLQWHDLPGPVFETDSNVPSAILRTDQPHTVIQGPGFRVTVSCQLVFADGNPEGVWEHIQNNINLIGA
jgi:hypothetical protein